VKGIIADTGEDICKALPTLHAFSWCDSTNAFVHTGKVVVPRLLQKNPEFVEAFMQFGTTEESWINYNTLQVTCMDPPN
jgi:hypothetical protein